MSHINQIYCKAPDESSLEADLLDQDLATENEEGTVQPVISITTWTPAKNKTTDADGNVTVTEADYILCLVGWTENSMQAAGLSQSEVDQLLAAGTLANGTEIDVDVPSLDLHESEPRLTTYGA
jgi:hypothetical protein